MNEHWPSFWEHSGKSCRTSLAGQVVEYSQEDYALNDLARDIAGKLPQDVVCQVYAGRLQAEAMTLQTALGEYQ